LAAIPTNTKHGTAYAYNKGCRCDLCRAANSSRRRGKAETAKVVTASANPDYFTPPKGYVRAEPRADSRFPHIEVHTQCWANEQLLLGEIAKLRADLDFARVAIDGIGPEVYEEQVRNLRCRTCSSGPFTKSELAAHRDTNHNEYNQAIEVDGVRAG
jgi:hypothetical protein